MISQISTYIIREVIQNTQDCQYVLYQNEIESEFGIALSTKDIYDIENELGCRQEVSDVLFIDHGFDVVVGTSYIPNYEY